MKPICTSAALAIAFGSLGALPAYAEQMSPSQIEAEMIGRTLEGRRMGMRMEILYDPSGVVTFSSALMNGTGTWEASSDGICVNIPSGPREGETCVTVERLDRKSVV